MATTRIVALTGEPLPVDPPTTVNPTGTPEKYVSSQEMSVVEDYYTSDDVVMACREVLQWFLFREDVRITFGTDAKPFRKEYASEIRAFFVDALDAFLKFGFVVWAKVPGRCGQWVPRVLDTGSYTVLRTINRDLTVTYRAELRFHGGGSSSSSEEEGEAKPFVSVEVVPGYAPNMFGSLTSKIKTLLWAEENARALQLYQRRAAAEGSDLTLFTEMRMEKGSTSEATVALSYFNVDRSKKRKQYELNTDAQNQLDRQLEAKRRRNQGLGMRGHRSDRWRTNPNTGRREPVDDAIAKSPSIALPRGQTIVRQTPPVQPNNVLQWEEKREAKVCAVLGVPRAAAALKGAGSAGGGRQLATAVASEMNMLNATIDKTKRVLKIIGEDVLNKMLGKADRQEIRDKLMDEQDAEEQARLERELTCENLYTVEFGLTSNLTPQDLKELHGIKVLKPEAEARLLSAAYGVPVDYIDIESLKEWKKLGFGPAPGSKPNGVQSAATPASTSKEATSSKATSSKAAASSSSKSTDEESNKKQKKSSSSSKGAGTTRKQPARGAKRGATQAKKVQSKTPEEPVRE